MKTIDQIAITEPVEPWPQTIKNTNGARHFEPVGAASLRVDDRDFPQDFATAKAKAHDPKLSTLIHTNPTAAEVWFGNVQSGNSKNVIMREESMRLGQRGVLTLLSA